MSAPDTHPAPARRSFLDLSLYLITDTALCGAIGVPATVQAAVASGVSAVQLRDPAATDAELVALGRQVRAALEPAGVPLIVNDRVHLVEQIGAQGAHVGQDDLPVTEARTLLGDHAYLGLSVHSPAEAQAAATLEPGVVDYLGVGPVWATHTKPAHRSPVGTELLREMSTISPWPCVAIGGITAERAPQLRGTGVVGIAVVSAVCGQHDVAAATARLRRVWKAEP